jgi:hypothetical protein
MSEHIVYPRVYIGIFLILLVGTLLTVLAAFSGLSRSAECSRRADDRHDQSKPSWCSISCTSVIAVRLVWVVIGSALFWLGIMFALTISDYSSRGWLPISTM